MKKVVAALVLISSFAAQAAPVVIDLSDEQREFEQKVQSRRGSVAFAGFAGLSVAAAVYGFASASSTRAELQAQRVPVDTNQRRQLLENGVTSNGIGVAGTVLGVGLLAASGYFLILSF